MNSSGERSGDKLYVSVEELQTDLHKWLHYYNYERPHHGYSNMGKKSIEAIRQVFDFYK
jgi:hypothetical protein